MTTPKNSTFLTEENYLELKRGQYDPCGNPFCSHARVKHKAGVGCTHKTLGQPCGCKQFEEEKQWEQT